MAIIKIKTGGRPITIDTTKEISKLEQALPRAKNYLREIRLNTSGYRGDILGTEQELPSWLDMTFSALKQAEKTGKLSLQLAREVRENIASTQRLASTSVKSRNIALATQLFKEYESQINRAINKGSKFTKAVLNQIKATTKKMSKRQFQKFATSELYQDITTIGTKEYERITQWSRSQTGDSTLSYQEAGYYLIYRRMQEGLPTESLQGIFNYDELMLDEEEEY